jgi:hypothetical protein
LHTKLEIVVENLATMAPALLECSMRGKTCSIESDMASV